MLFLHHESCLFLFRGKTNRFSYLFFLVLEIFALHLLLVAAAVVVCLVSNFQFQTS